MKKALFGFVVFACLMMSSIYGYAVAPTISSFSPTSGPVGTLVTISGTNLGSPTAFTIGGKTAIVVSNTGSTLVGLVMPGSTTGLVSISTAGGTTTSIISFTITTTPYPVAQQGNKLVGTGAVGNANQGQSVALSADGTTAIVGGFNDNSGIGAVWVYTCSGAVWTQQGSKLVGTGAVGNANQGQSVALSADGNTALVGGYADHSYAGAVWVYTRSGGIWTQQGTKLVGTGGDTASQQGVSVALSADGNTAMVGGQGDHANAGAVWVFIRNAGTWSQQGTKLVGTAGDTLSQQGSSVALSANGNTALIGGFGDHANAGAAWVFTRSGVTWTQQGTKLVGTGGDTLSQQGASVALSADGNTGLWGGYYDHAGTGAAWVFTRSGVTWTQQGNKLVGTSPVGTAYQGQAVALSADGNIGMITGGGDNSGIGAAWLFTRSGTTWTQKGNKFVGTGAVGNSNQGLSLALSADGNAAIVGGGSDNSSAGAAWVYNQPPPTITAFTPSSGPVGTLITLTGTLLGNPTAFTIGGTTAIVVSNTGTTLVGLVMPGSTTGAVSISTSKGTANAAGNFTMLPTPYPSLQQGNKLVGTGGVATPLQGYSVAVSADGNTAIVGGSSDNSGIGAAWVYSRSGSTWTLQGSKLVGTGAVGNANQGSSVALSADGNTAIVGGILDNTSIGAVWVYTRSAGVWTQQGTKLVGTVFTGTSNQGSSTALSADGNTAIVGGSGDNTNAGALWVYTRSAGAWTQQGAKLVGTAAAGNAAQGTSVALSADGNTAIVGGSGDNTNAGAVWVYTRSAGTWTQQGSKLVGTVAVGNATQGTSVALSADGNTAIVGGSGDNTNAGAVWVFTRTGVTWTQQGAKLVGTAAVGTAAQGSSVALSADGNTAIVGGTGDNANAGALWVYTRSAGVWTQQGSQLLGTGAVGSAKQGFSAALSANASAAIVGGTNDNANAGAAWVFVPCPNNTVALSSSAGTNGQTSCINTAITDITYTTTGASGATVTGLPAGVTDSWASNVETISGTPTASGIFNYTITLTGGCGTITTNGTITVTPNSTVALSSTAGTDGQTLCNNTAITNISYSSTGATGASVTGLPAGVTGNWASNVETLSGTPTASGNFNYTVTLTGGCGTVTKAGTLTITPSNTATLSSGAGTDAQIFCFGQAITPITYTTTGATGASVTGLPAGVNASWSANVETISGTPNVAGTYNYTITLIGGCGPVLAVGTITVKPNNTAFLSSSVGSTVQSVCINTAIQNVTYSTTGATGATVTGLPTGVSGNWAANVVTIAGSPSVSGAFNYTITLTGGCGTVTKTGTITVSSSLTATLSSATSTDAQTLCNNTTITNITYATTGATGATVTGLPAGVSGSWASNVVTIGGTPNALGTFNYTVTLSGGCGTITKTGTITTTPNNTTTLSSAAGTTAQTLCINTSITNITYATSGSTGGTVTGLPAGVTDTWASNLVTISGTPTVAGVFNYTLSSNGSCGTTTRTGSITVTPDNTANLSSAVGTDGQTLCINSSLTDITYATSGVTGSSITGLPAGVTSNWASNKETISGIPTASGSFSYTVTLTGGCGTITVTGTIIVTPKNTATLTSLVGTDGQTGCINTAITDITYVTTGATGAFVSGLPAGVTASWASNMETISGTPVVSGPFNYTITMTGGCGATMPAGTITVTPNNSATLTSAPGTDAQTMCTGPAITPITYSTSGATGASVTGLPAGVTDSWASNLETISGTPSASGIFNYTVTLTGGSCGTAIKTGKITVDICTAIANVGGINTAFKIFPNPSNDKVMIESNNLQEHTFFHLYNLLGEVIQSLEITGKETIIQRSGIPNGVYLYRIVNSNNQVVCGRLVYID
jgi:hypothetical protein